MLNYQKSGHKRNAKCCLDRKKDIKHKNLLLHIKMDKENLTFGDTEIEKKKFYHNKILVHLRDVGIKKALVANKISFGEKNYKYFIG